MDSSSKRDEPEAQDAEVGDTGGTGAGDDEQQPSGLRRTFRETLDALAERRRRLSEEDIIGRTPLFQAAEAGDLERVKEIIFSFRGTGMFPPRLSLIAQEDVLGLTAADVAEQNGHEEIEQLLRSEQGRMEFFE
jgi:ankyrin repeat protein